MAETASGAFSVVRFHISGAGPSGSVIKELINHLMVHLFTHWLDINRLITKFDTRELDVHL
jgi:hypothetical protein